MSKGCSQYKNNNMIKSESELLHQVIKVFDGEILGDKYEPPVKPTRTYKKKYVKSPHKYSHRKDAQ